ncbi:alpha-amylase family glycosyl hydrolase [Chitinophaga cymbidii]|uniref:Alpha-amylase n=1 Tax=Chitinophaga cymbidii TaxID=1096750 RepID=A0A512RQT3_9BACT|nr:alpha-amylase family glycosyl hydrolase [Chitinophaga cymbidii]GEP98040.1 alpha-amylase [Chitinophaga cymbidii]
MHILSMLFTWMMMSCGSKETIPPFTPPPVPSDSIAAVTQYGTPFNNVPDRPDAVIYQVNMRVFSAAGDFAGVINRLDSIKALGANVIYLMPLHPVGVLNGINSPYSIKDHTAVNPEFGTLADLRKLVEEAHDRDMSVIMDWVANHTAWDHVWMADHKDWYMQDNGGNVVSPPGMGWNDVAQLNFSNAAMRQAMIKAMRYWVLTANIDGFRCDYTDGPPVDFWKQAIDTLRKIPQRKLILLAEGSRAANFSAGFDYSFGFGFFNTLKAIYHDNRSVQSIDEQNTTDYEAISSTQHVVRYITNHDVNGAEGTPLELFGGEQGSMAAFVVACYMKGVPMIYNGQEAGTPVRLTFPFTSTKINWGIHPEITEEYKKVIAFRNSSAAIRKGQLVSYSTTDVCAFTKELNGERVYIIANLRNQAVSYTIPAPLQNTAWTNIMNGAATTLGTTITLSPYTYYILKE